MLELPSLDPAIDYLDAQVDPTIGLRLSLLRDPDADVSGFRRNVVQQPVVQEAFASQRDDGSWGEKERAAH